MDTSTRRKSILVVVFAFVFAMASGIIAHDWIIGSAVLFCSLLAAYFASIGKRSNYIFNFINYALMGYVAYRNNLYGTGTFYIFACLPLQIHGFINWGKNLEDDNVKTRRFNVKISLLVIVVCLVSSAVVGFLLSLIPSQQLSFLDAASNCVNICGIVLMNLRYMEAWWLWLVNNVLDLAIWTLILITNSGTNTVMMFITCIMFLVLNIYGICKWMKGSKVEVSS